MPCAEEKQRGSTCTHRTKTRAVFSFVCLSLSLCLSVYLSVQHAHTEQRRGPCFPWAHCRFQRGLGRADKMLPTRCVFLFMVLCVHTVKDGSDTPMHHKDRSSCTQTWHAQTQINIRNRKDKQTSYFPTHPPTHAPTLVRRMLGIPWDDGERSPANKAAGIARE